MKIAYLGNQRFPWCTEVHLSRTLTEDLGHEVVFLQEDEVGPSAVESIASKCDMLLWTRTWGLPGIERVLARLDSKGIPTASYHLDLYFHIQREKDMAGDPFWRTKYVFSPDGGSQDLFEKAGINHHFLWPAVFRQECVDGTFDPRFARDVGFVGSTEAYHFEWIEYRRKLLDHLRKYDFGIWPGSGPAVRGQDLNNLYASVKIAVGDTLCPGFNHPWYVSDRLFETIGRGGFLIHPRIHGLETAFRDGEEIVYYDYNDFDGLSDRIDHYLNTPDEREAIRKKGQKLIQAEHTYTNRLTRMLEIISEEEGW